MVGLSSHMKENENIHLNARVKIQGFYGTIKYVGSVENHPGIWVGVEWDDVSRGKHDGVVNNIRYFQTVHPYSGSMVRVEKLGEFQTLEEAIIDRYYEKDENVLDEYLIKETRQFMQAPLLEIVGMDKIRKKQSNLDELKEVALVGAPVNKCGDLSQLLNITNLDLSSTLIWNWGIVMNVVSQLKHLEYIDLSNNRLLLPSNGDLEEFVCVANKVKGINLRNNGITNWEEVLKIATLWPNIEFLSLQDNDLIAIDKFVHQEDVFLKLEKLDLQGNKLENFDNVVNLGHLKHLKELLLGNNRFTELKMPDCNYKEKLDIFVGLEKLNLRDNFIKDDVSCFNELDKLLSLENISYSSVSGESYEDTAYKAIALITGLKTLNKRRIEVSDRRNAEIDTWKQLFAKWFELNDDDIGREKFLNKFRAYPKLLVKYGTPDMHILDAAVNKKPGSYKILLEHLKSGKKIEKKLPSKMSIHALYGLISKLFGVILDGDDFNLVAIDPRCDNIRIPLDPSSKTIDYYSIKEGDTILIQ